MWLPRTAVSVDAFHLVKLGKDMLTEVRQRLTQQVHGRRGRSIDPVWANRRLLLRGRRYTLGPGPEHAQHRVRHREATGSWQVKEQLRALLATGSLADAAAAKDRLQNLVERASQPETNRLWRTICRWWKEIEVLIVTGATTAKVEANNTAIKHIKRAGLNRPSRLGQAWVYCCQAFSRSRCFWRLVMTRACLATSLSQPRSSASSLSSVSSCICASIWGRNSVLVV